MSTYRSVTARSSLSLLLLCVSFLAAASTQTIKEPVTIHMAIISLAPPSKIYQQWKPFADYIAETAKYPENVFGAHNDINPDLQQLSEIITGKQETTSGKIILKDMHSMKILNFVTYDTKTEDIIHKLLKTAEFEQ